MKSAYTSFYNFSWHTANNSIVLNILNYYSIRCYRNVISNFYPPPIFYFLLR